MQVGNIQFKTHDVDVKLTYLQGMLQCDYHILCNVFGNPQKGNGYYTQVEWHCHTEDGVVFTIYDWREDCQPQSVYQWCIGGFDYRAVQTVNKIIEEYYNVER